jgi:hypothetical protein
MTRELALAEAVNQAFQVFLAARARLGLQVSFVDIGGEFIKTLVAGQDRAAEIAVPTGIAFGNMILRGCLKSFIQERSGLA